MKCFIVAPVLLLLVPAVFASDPAKRDGAVLEGLSSELVTSGELVPSTITGVVQDADGIPVFGALVTTSGGGEALTDAYGYFELAIEVPREAERVQVDVVSGAATASIGVEPRPYGSTMVTPLVVSEAADCFPRWLPTFGGRPGTNFPVRCSVVFDDGNGPELYIGGLLSQVEGKRFPRIARWNGKRWAGLDKGLLLGTGAFALAVYDDGKGKALYAAGDFGEAGGVPADAIARWDGKTWTPLGTGIEGVVYALEVFDDGTGAALYAAGEFSMAGGLAVESIARWDGSTWSAVGGGLLDASGDPADVRAMAVYDDGTGPALYAGGGFVTAGGSAASFIAKWDGNSWSPLGAGVTGSPLFNMKYSVNALEVFDGGAGPLLFVGGNFEYAGGQPVLDLATWNGVDWSDPGSTISGDIQCMTVYDDGSGPLLLAGGNIVFFEQALATEIVSWDGADWSLYPPGLGAATLEEVSTMTAYDDGTGVELFAGGEFQFAYGTVVNNLARWDGLAWSALGAGPSEEVRATAVFDNEAGPVLVVGGSLRQVGGTSAPGIAQWDGSSWAPLGQFLGGASSPVLAIEVFDDGAGPALYAGGSFSVATPEKKVSHVARWNGSDWVSLGEGLTGPGASVTALKVFDDGSGPALYAGGNFTFVDGKPSQRCVAKWDGANWTAIGPGGLSSCAALEVYDDGTGPALYAGGSFRFRQDSDLFFSDQVVKWDGVRWTALEQSLGPAGLVLCLEVFDDGEGSELYAGGKFQFIDGQAASNIARWNGSEWSAVGSGVDDLVSTLHAFDAGSGQALYAGGRFKLAGGALALRVAKWQEGKWSPLRRGLPDWVRTLISFDDGGGPALIAGGAFTYSTSGDSYLAKFGCE